MERGHGPGEVEAALAERAPEALHLSPRLGVVGFGVEERDAEPRAGGLEEVAAIGGAVVEIEPVGLAVTA